MPHTFFASLLLPRWSICNCKASKSLPGYSSSTCKGPLCSLFQRPDLPSLNFALPNIKLEDIGPLIDVNSYDWSQLGQLFQVPTFNLPKVRWGNSI